jgi:phosphoribosylformylglycinamidine synthase
MPVLFLARVAGQFPSKSPGARMKAKIIITPKKAVLDPQGKTVQNALAQMGYTGVTGVHIGKYIEIDLAPGTDPAAAHKALNEAAHRLLSNPVIEDYRLEIE